MASQQKQGIKVRHYGANARDEVQYPATSEASTASSRQFSEARLPSADRTAYNAATGFRYRRPPGSPAPRSAFPEAEKKSPLAEAQEALAQAKGARNSAYYFSRGEMNNETASVMARTRQKRDTIVRAHEMRISLGLDSPSGKALGRWIDAQNEIEKRTDQMFALRDQSLRPMIRDLRARGQFPKDTSNTFVQQNHPQLWDKLVEWDQSKKWLESNAQITRSSSGKTQLDPSLLPQRNAQYDAAWRLIDGAAPSRSGGGVLVEAQAAGVGPTAASVAHSLTESGTSKAQADKIAAEIFRNREAMIAANPALAEKREISISRNELENAKAKIFLEEALAKGDFKSIRESTEHFGRRNLSLAFTKMDRASQARVRGIMAGQGGEV